MSLEEVLTRAMAGEALSTNTPVSLTIGGKPALRIEGTTDEWIELWLLIEVEEDAFLLLVASTALEKCLNLN